MISLWHLKDKHPIIQYVQAKYPNEHPTTQDVQQKYPDVHPTSQYVQPKHPDKHPTIYGVQAKMMNIQQYRIYNPSNTFNNICATNPRHPTIMNVQPSERSTWPHCPNPRYYGEKWSSISSNYLDQCLLHSLDWTKDTLSASTTLSLASFNLANQA